MLRAFKYLLVIQDRRAWEFRDSKSIKALVRSLLTEKVKVKVTLVQALRLCTGRTAHRGSRDIAPLFHDHGTRRG